MMKMAILSILVSGGSDPRDRQVETIVPGLCRSGFGKSCVGLSSVLAASTGEACAIAGMLGACTAGVPNFHAPARGCPEDMTPGIQRKERESEG